MPLIVSAGGDRALRSWRLDGTPVELRVNDTHSDWIRTLTVLDHGDAPLIVRAGNDRAITAWQVRAARQLVSS